MISYFVGSFESASLEICFLNNNQNQNQNQKATLFYNLEASCLFYNLEASCRVSHYGHWKACFHLTE